MKKKEKEILEDIARWVCIIVIGLVVVVGMGLFFLSMPAF